MTTALKIMAALTALLACQPAWAAGKKEGVGESGGGAVAPIASTAAGLREKMVAPEQVGDALGTLSLSATMMAGAGAGKCRMNFVLFNNSTATVALGMIATAVSAKSEILDNWVVNIGALPPGGQTARLFSCAIGAVQLVLVPLGEFSWPPVKCLNAKQETEACAVAFQIKSSLPMIDKDQLKPPDPGGGAKKH